MKPIFIPFSIMLLSMPTTYAVPENVIIIRHAEKNTSGESLNFKGQSRACALPYYFASNPLFTDPNISYVFAPKLYGPVEKARTYQTCKPTADFYGLPVNTDFRHTQIDDVANEILTNPKYDKATILLCWTHGKIGRLVKALGGEDPGKWDSHIYDQVYVLSFKEKQSPKFRKEIQKLMYGDRSRFKGFPSTEDFNFNYWYEKGLSKLLSPFQNIKKKQN